MDVCVCTYVSVNERERERVCVCVSACLCTVHIELTFKRVRASSIEWVKLNHTRHDGSIRQQCSLSTCVSPKNHTHHDGSIRQQGSLCTCVSNCTSQDKKKQLSQFVTERWGKNCRQHQRSTVTTCRTLRVKQASIDGKLKHYCSKS